MKNFNKLIKEALTPDFLKENQGQGWEEYRDIGYEIFHAAPHGYRAEAYPQFGYIINSKAYFDTYDEAKEHAELEIDGYLDDTRSSHYDDALDPDEFDEFDKPLNENKSIYDAKINQLPKEIQDALKGEWEDDDFEDVTVYYHERGPKEGTGYVNFAMFNPSAGDELHKSLTKAGLKLDPLRSFQDGNFIKVYLNESINEAKELTQDDIYNFLKPKFKDTKRATYKVDKVGKQVVVSWKITKTGYKDSKGDLFVDLDDMDFTSNYGSGKNWNTKAQLLSGLKKFIRDDAKSIHG